MAIETYVRLHPGALAIAGAIPTQAHESVRNVAHQGLIQMINSHDDPETNKGLGSETLWCCRSSAGTSDE
ncbi:MAG TPA: hypothetical protein VMW65_03515 [Chloroflexota bacterium]|nr:hypothetical protein [Chloroflexota bacterium]